MVIERLFLPELLKIDETDKKVCAIGVTHLLCDPLPMISGIYFEHLWLPLLQVLLELFESSNELQTMSAAERKKQILEEADEELLVGLDDTPGKNNIYTYRIRGRKINRYENIVMSSYYAHTSLFIFVSFKIIRQLFHVWLLRRNLIQIYLVQLYRMLDVI
jgi:hypothetical protein